MTDPAAGQGTNDIYAFPPSGTALSEGGADEREAEAFLAAVYQWRSRAGEWLTTQARKGRVSERLADLLRWSLGDSVAAVTPPTLYAVRRLPDGSQRTAGKRALDLLVWRSGLVDFLADVWDTLGPSEFELEECTRVIDDLLTPTVLRGILACPDCLRTFTDHRDLATHTIECPIRRLRLDG